MKVYIGNPTAQDRQVSCRPPESPKNVVITVQAGRQAPLGDFTDAQIKGIVAQLSVFGLATVDEAMRFRRPTHYLYSLGRPLSASDILKVFENNKERMREDGALRRKAMAVKAGQEVDAELAKHGNDQTRALELSLEEEKRGETRDGGSISEDSPIAEGVRFLKEGEQPGPRPAGRRRRAA